MKSESELPDLPSGYKWSAHTGTPVPGFVHYTVKLKKLFRVAGIPFYVSMAADTGYVRSEDYFMLSERINESALKLLLTNQPH